MARNQYTPDEFDRLPEGTPTGVHRRSPRPWTRVAVFCAIALTGVGLAWGVARLYLIADDVPFLNWLRSAFEDDQPQVTPDPIVVTPSPTPSPSPSPSPSPTYSLMLNASVIVYDQSDIGVLDDMVVEYILSQNAFTDISTGEWDGANPPANVIRYSAEQYESTAKYLASLFGITTITLGPTEDADIEIVLIADVPFGPEPSPSPSATP